MKKKPSQVIADCAFAAGLYLKSAPLTCIVYTALQSLSWASNALSLAVFGGLVDAMIGGRWERGSYLVAAYVGLIFARSVLSAVEQYYGALLQDRSSFFVSSALLEAVSRSVTVEVFDSPRFHDSAQALGGLQMRLYQAARGILGIVPQVAAVVSYTALLWPVSPYIPLPILLSLVPQVFFKHSYVTVYSMGVMGQAPEQRKLEYIRKLLFDPQAAGEIRFLDLIPRLVARHKALFDAVMNRELAVAKRKSGATSLLALSSWSGVAAAVVIGLVKVSKGAGSPGTIAVILGASTTLSFYLFQLVDWLGIMDMLSTDMDKLRDMFELTRETGGTDGDTYLDGHIEEVTLERVSFSYPGSERKVLDNVDLTLRKGETVAIVGLNGAGKTTLAKVILGLYRPSEGRVLVNGRDLSDYRQADVRKRVSCVFQDFGQYLLTIRENVGFGEIGKMHDDVSLWAALEEADAADLVRRLDDGLDARLGKQFGGSELSGGEWQKIALARCLLRDADFLVLDEPSAALDVEAEHNLYLKFKEMLGSAPGRMCIIISHRFTTVRMADRILVLEAGRIAEQGTHDQLMGLGGTYAKLYHQQADRYGGCHPLVHQPKC